MQSLYLLPLSSKWSDWLRTAIFALVGVLLISGNTAAAATPDAQRFQLAGSGTLKPDQPLLKSGNVQLRAYLVPAGAAPAASTIVQAGGPFALSAILETASLVCFNDTIFRDDFDGDGF